MSLSPITATMRSRWAGYRIIVRARDGAALVFRGGYADLCAAQAAVAGVLTEEGLCGAPHSVDIECRSEREERWTKRKVIAPDAVRRIIASRSVDHLHAPRSSPAPILPAAASPAVVCLSPTESQTLARRTPGASRTGRYVGLRMPARHREAERNAAHVHSPRRHRSAHRATRWELFGSSAFLTVVAIVILLLDTGGDPLALFRRPAFVQPAARSTLPFVHVQKSAHSTGLFHEPGRWLSDDRAIQADEPR